MGKALILVGGFGTRLRPLTFTKAKPLVEFINKPILKHQVEALVKVGVDEIVLAVNYQPDRMKAALEEMSSEFGVKIVCSLETEPMGTAGPLALAREHLSDGQPFFVFNSDVTCEYPLQAMLDFHKSHGKEGTILTTPVSDPSKYGVVVHEADGRIQRFVEKPKEFVGSEINAGMYILNPSVLERIPLKPTSIEREVFPLMAEAGELYCMAVPGFWMDIGQPKDYLTGQCLYLEHASKARGGAGLASESEEKCEVVGACVIDPSAKIGEGAVIGPNVVIGPGVVVGAGARVIRSTLLEGATVGAHAYIFSSIIGWRARIGKWARIDEHSVIGEEVGVKDGVCCNGGIILPNKDVKANIYTPGTIIM